MNCKKCGAPLQEGDVFCGNCGFKTVVPAETVRVDTVPEKQALRPNSSAVQIGRDKEKKATFRYAGMMVCIVVAIVALIGFNFYRSSHRNPSSPPRTLSYPDSTSDTNHPNPSAFNADTPSPDESNGNPNSTTERVVNVVSPDFELSDGFIVPVMRQTTVPDGYIGIYTAEEFDKIRNNRTAKYILMGDIDLSSLPSWEPSYLSGGILDGNGYTVSNATAPLFMYANQSMILNLGVVSVFSISRGLELAGIAEEAENSSIDNCFFAGKMLVEGVYDSKDRAGGIVGTIRDGNVSNCYNLANLSSKGYLGGIAGGIIGGGLYNCFNAGTLSSYGIIGGIAGVLNESVVIFGCYNSGTITNSSQVMEQKIGGIVGINSETGTKSIHNCFNVGNISVSNVGQAAVSGILGSGYFTEITDCYNAGNISIKAFEGDFVYKSQRGYGITLASGDIRSCYNIGEIDADKDGKVGGISSETSIEACYFIDKANDATPSGALFAENDHVKKLTDTEMKQPSSFVGFDFDGIWTMGGYDYPYPVFLPQY